MLVGVITLYTGLSVHAQGSTSNIIYHANPSIDGKTWYDDVSVLDSVTAVRGTPRLHAGRLRAFVVLHESDGTAHTLAFLHGYRAHTLRNNNTPNLNVFDKRSQWCDEAPYPFVKFLTHSNGKPVFWLVDVETISAGLWVQQSFDTANSFIILQHGV